MEDHVRKISEFITDDPDIINESWEELGIEDPNFNQIELTPEEEAEIARRSYHIQGEDGSWKPKVEKFEPKSKKDLNLHQEYEELFNGDGCFCSMCGGTPGIIGDTLINLNDSKQVKLYMQTMSERLERAKQRAREHKVNRSRFNDILGSNSEINGLFKGIKQVINDYNLKMDLDETESYEDNLYLHYGVGGLNAIGNYVDTLFELRLNIINGRLSAETFSYWVDGGKTWDPFDLNDAKDLASATSVMKEKGYDVNYKKYGNTILDALSFHCRLFPQLQTEVGLSEQELAKVRASKHKELSQKEEYGYYKVTGDIEIGPDDVYYGKDLWVEAMSAQHAIEKSGMLNAKITGYMPPKPL